MPIPHATKVVELPNGVKCLFINVPGSPVVCYSINFTSGPDESTRAFPFQVAHTLEHIVEAGPDDPVFPEKSVYLQEIQKNGAGRNALTGEYGISYLGDCTPDEIVRILKLRLSAIQNPKLHQSILTSESGNVLEEMKQRVADYPRLASALARKVLSDNQWQTSREAMDEASRVTLDNVKAYYANTHTTQNMNVAISGDIADSEDSIIALLETTLLQDGTRLYGPAIIPEQTDTHSFEHRPSLENLFTSLVMALPRKLSTAESAAMDLANNLLCNSWNSLILGKARDRGLCYSMGGHVDVSRTQSMWMLNTPVSPKNATAFFELMSEGLRHISKEGVEQQVLQQAKDLLIGRWRKHGQTSQELLSSYWGDFIAFDEVSSLDEYIDALQNTSNEDIIKLTNEFLSSGSRVFSGVGSISDSEFKLHYEVITERLEK